nr:reverse transcriptase domain-containing protein [Tanacetum cinerariifolium]
MVKGYDEKKTLKLVVVKLKKYASLWFDNVEHERRLEGKKRINTWSKLKECIMYYVSVPQQGSLFFGICLK